MSDCADITPDSQLAQAMWALHGVAVKNLGQSEWATDLNPQYDSPPNDEGKLPSPAAATDAAGKFLSVDLVRRVAARANIVTFYTNSPCGDDEFCDGPIWGIWAHRDPQGIKYHVRLHAGDCGFSPRKWIRDRIEADYAVTVPVGREWDWLFCLAAGHSHPIAGECLVTLTHALWHGSVTEQEIEAKRQIIAKTAFAFACHTIPGCVPVLRAMPAPEQEALDGLAADRPPLHNVAEGVCASCVTA